MGVTWKEQPPYQNWRSFAQNLTAYADTRAAEVESQVPDDEAWEGSDPGTIEDVLAVENDVVPFDRADVLGAPDPGGRRGCRVAARPSLVTASARPVRLICLLANSLRDGKIMARCL